MLKRLSGMSRSAINRTRAFLGPSETREALPVEPLVVPRTDHPVSRKFLSHNALKVLNRLHENGHAAYLVGGGVRDVLVGLKPKDFDVATDASPEDVRALFRNSRIIGRRFRLVHVVFGRDVIEVATFRASHDKGEGGEVGDSGRIMRDNVYGTIAEDALRRDFSVNALYYNIADHSLVDYAGGLDDIEARVFHLIGDPVKRCEEDPVRVLRAVRLAAKLEFSIHPDTLAAMRSTAHGLSQVPPARLFEEVLKLFQGGYAERSFNAIVEHGLLQYIFPLLHARLAQDSASVNADSPLRTMLAAALANTDRRVEQGKPITPYYLLAFMLWPDVEERAQTMIRNGSSAFDALGDAADAVMAIQIKATSIPKRFSGPMREIWYLQPRLEQSQGARAIRLIEGRRFRAAYDFLCLRAAVQPDLATTADWWTQVQEEDPDAQLDFAASKPTVGSQWGSTGKPRRNRGASSRRKSGQQPGAAASSSAAESAADTAAPKKRRRRRRRPGGDKARQGNVSSGGSGNGNTHQ